MKGLEILTTTSGFGLNAEGGVSVQHELHWLGHRCARYSATLNGVVTPWAAA